MLRPYLYGAAITALLALAGGSYVKGRLDGSRLCDTAALEAQVATLTGRAETAERLATEYAERFRIDADLDRLNQDRANDTPANDAACLPRDAARRVRDIR